MGRFQDPGCTIFVKNIEPRVTEEHLWELFLQAGPLRNVHIPLDRGTGRKRNFAFVTYRDEMSVDYACQLFNQIRLFKKPIYCNPSKDKDSSKGSFSQSPSNRSNTSDNPQSPTSNNNSLIDGILNRTNGVPLTSTPYNGKRKYSQDSGRMPPPDNRSDSRVIVVDDDRDQRFNNTNERDRNRYSEHDDRDRNRYGNSNDRDRSRYDDMSQYRSNTRDDRDGSIGYNRSDSRDNSRDGERRYDDRSSGSRYERSNSFGNMSPMHMQVLNQYNRQNSSPRDNSSFGPMKQDKNARRQRSHPY